MVLHMLEEWLVANVDQIFQNQSWTPPPPPREYVEALFWPGLGFWLMAVMELSLCRPQLQRLWHTKGPAFHSLYRQAWWANAINHFVLGPITYHVTVQYICHKPPHQQQQQQDEMIDTSAIPYVSFAIHAMQHIVQCLGMLLVEGILYYVVHRAFHEIPGCYWMHKFHHQFRGREGVLPSTASAVSLAEFTLAYMLPFPIGAWIAGCTKWSALSAATLVAISNLYIHTPPLQEFVSKLLPWWMVSTADHLQHHTTVKTAYGAPLVSCDRILAWMWGESKQPSFSLSTELLLPAAKRLSNSSTLSAGDEDSTDSNPENTTISQTSPTGKEKWN
mmetsp:Transcript_22492/g.48989  ORF Transcript_22492/g.48989 Transcript_22492/m.48989 type:complete len:332 (+) Transcript_22492:199-1194(+)|eukprot:CAMPEP_0168737620 /NCGR_PEP_ID=MMETSP0724-20121128/10492_1 /TAXON_ID=265536 /ORGANISM="Amphiprora sp., Strain CCMP467" /LENGTH=331 /DNA_ID=CAMNT_0008784899 /DNA_START=167 /DNA_END=1162 /DNA_ORIENTATION=-